MSNDREGGKAEFMEQMLATHELVWIGCSSFPFWLNSVQGVTRAHLHLPSSALGTWNYLAIVIGCTSPTLKNSFYYQTVISHLTSYLALSPNLPFCVGPLSVLVTAKDSHRNWFDLHAEHFQNGQPWALELVTTSAFPFRSTHKRSQPTWLATAINTDVDGPVDSWRSIYCHDPVLFFVFFQSS